MLFLRFAQHGAGRGESVHGIAGGLQMVAHQAADVSIVLNQEN